jgi:hypothetical protein
MSTPNILYENRFEDSTSLTASDTDTGFAVSNITDWRTYTLWKANSTGTHTITIDTEDTAASADTLGIIGHNLGSIGSTVSIQVSTNSSFDTETTVASAINPTSDDRLIYEEFVTTAVGRYWKMTINAPSTPFAKMGVAVLGNRMQFPDEPRSPVVPSRTGIVADTRRSQQGNILGNVIKYKPVTNQYTFPASETSTGFLLGDYETFWDIHGSELKPFFFALDSSNLPADIYFTQLTEGSQFQITRQTLSLTGEWSISMTGIKED